MSSDDDEIEAGAGPARLRAARRVVVKVGTTLLIDPAGHRLNVHWLDTLIDDVATLRGDGAEIVIVSSGAIGLGRGSLGLPDGRLRLEENQAAAAVGQVHLAHAYEEALRRRGIVAAQILLTLEDTEARKRYLNARGTLGTLLKLGAVPVVNENDTVATSEIRYGDNDRLAARVAQMLGADVLVLLSDIDRLYTADPNEDPSAEPLAVIRELTDDVAAMAGASRTPYGTGGMKTKIAAARIATAAGCAVVLGDGRREHPLDALARPGPCTWFLAHDTPVNARKQWIGGALKPAGSLTIDAGAARALAAGKSLLPAGVIGVDGQFGRGEALSVLGADGREIARGLCAYSRIEAERIAGCRSTEIEAALGYRGRAAMIHRDDLVMMNAPAGSPGRLETADD